MNASSTDIQSKNWRIDAVEHYNDTMKKRRLSCLAPHQAGHSTRTLQGRKFWKQLNANISERDPSDWALPVLFVPKVDSSLCSCIDYLCMNEETIGNTYPLLRIGRCNDYLDLSKPFSTLNAELIVGQYALRKKIEKKKLLCATRVFLYKRVPSRLTN